MNTRDIIGPLTTLFTELVDGAPPVTGAYMLNHDDPGLLRSLDKLSATAASTPTPTGSTIAGHVEHVWYGLSLMNRWSAGETNPWKNADWSKSWLVTSVSDDEWAALRARLADEAHRWLEALRSPREVTEPGMNIIIGTIAHLGYHLGAIRQIDQSTKGPTAND